MKPIDAMFKVTHKKTGVLIIGAGGAGLRAAVEVGRSGEEVAVACRSSIGRGGLTPTGNGGYHGAVWPGDSPEIHADDLITMGCCLNDRNLVRALTEDSVREARVLEAFGARVDWDVPPKPAEPQMRYPRSLFVPGREVLAALGGAVKKLDNVLLLRDHLALRLLTKDGEVVGAVLLDLSTGHVVVCESKATVLATGSLGEIYPLTGQEPMGIPTGSTGSGYVLAGWAGADLVDMEMTQFTVMPVDPPVVRGMRFLPWVPLLNRDGKAFLPPHLGAYAHEAAQAVVREITEGRGPVYLDMRGKTPAVPKRNPILGLRSARLRAFEATPFQRIVEVNVGMLYMMGGVHINERCETTVGRLYAAGEVSGNVHGARRVSGNAFPEMIVFGARAGKYAARASAKETASPEAPGSQIDETLGYLENLVRGGGEGISPKEVRDKVKSIMGEHAYVFRDGEGIQTALKELAAIEKDLPAVRIEPVGGLAYNPRLLEGIDARWLLAVSRIICHAALLREESRGFHFRRDFPHEKDAWLKHTVVTSTDGAAWLSRTRPITL